VPAINHRDRLIDAALELLATKGYARTTARELVGASGASLASISYHFGSKDALLEEAIEIAFDRWTDEVTRIVRAEEGTPSERLARGLAEVLHAYERNRPALVAFVEALAQVERSAEIKRRLADYYERTRRMLGELIEEQADALEGIDARSAGSLLLAIVDGLIVQYLLDPARTPSGAELERLVKGLAATLNPA
jgi:AcrR family transcriptional regulator